MRYKVCIYQTYWWHGHMPEIYHAYGRYILCICWKVEIYHIYTMIIHDYLWYILRGIYHVYTTFIQCICLVYILYILGIYIWYVLNILCIYMVYTVYIHSIIHVYSPPSGWCCRGGQGPIPPTPPAITSPGRVITLIWPHSSAHFGFLLLAMWMHRARLEL